MKVILDNGHGNNTPGKRSPKGMLTYGDPKGTALYEFEFNRDLVCRIKKGLQELGIECEVLVPEDRDISLKERVKRANKIFKEHPGSFLISVHANAAQTINTGSGWEAWTSVGQTESDVIAEFLYNEAERFWRNRAFRVREDEHSDGDKDKEAHFYILKHTKCPAVLTENGFMDHEKDLILMMSDTGRQQFADIHINAIKNYLSYKK